MEKQEFIKLYPKLTIKEIAEILDCSTTTIRTMARELNLPKKGSGRPKKIKS